MLPKEAVLEFKAIYEKHNKVKLSFEEAAIKSEEFMSLFQKVYKPIRNTANLTIHPTSRTIK